VCFVPSADVVRVESSQRSLDCQALVRFASTDQQSPTKAAAADVTGAAAYSDCYAVLTHLVRDWSDDGAAARRAVYEPILKLLSRHVPTIAAAAAAAEVDSVRAAPPLLLVPGAGLGRLCVELAASGWRVQANECSGVMLAAANSIVNSRSSSSSNSSTSSSTSKSAASIFPYLHDTNSDQLQSESRFRAVQYAQNVDALLAAAAPRLAFRCGDFLQLYSAPAAASVFDAAVTCFFIDTAADIRQYLSTLATAVRVGGFWVNLGPLHFHRNAQLVLSFDELQLLIAAAGWTMLHCEQLPPCDYRAASAAAAAVGATDAVGGSTYVEQYRPLLWVCQRSSVVNSIGDSKDDRDSDTALRQQLLYEGLFTQPNNASRPS
jgi:N2227-like protein